MRTPRTPPTVNAYQTGHRHMCAILRAILVDAVRAGRRAAGGIGTVPCQAVATLYLLLMNHPVDRRGRCRSCRRTGAVFGRRRRRCRVHNEATVWLHQPAEFLRTQLAGELGLEPAAAGQNRPVPFIGGEVSCRP